MYLVSRLFGFAIRMWFYSAMFSPQQRNARRRPQEGGRAFYKSVFGYVFGEGDPNLGFETAERTRIVSYIRNKRGVITVEELMALTGRDLTEAHALINRLLLEYEGDPRVTDNGTVVYVFPELLRTTEAEQRSFSSASLETPFIKATAPFSANNRRTNVWISFFNVFNLIFGTFFLLFPLTPGMSVVLAGNPEAARVPVDGLTFFYSLIYNFLAAAGIGRPDALMGIVLGIIPAAFSVFFFIIPFFRSLKLKRENERIRKENLRKFVYSQVLADPALVNPKALRVGGAESSPRNLDAARAAIIQRLAATVSGEPVPLPDGSFAYRFPELEKEMADLREYRSKVDVKSFEVGKTVFDTDQ